MKQSCLLFILFLLPMTASADKSGKCGANLEYYYNSTNKSLRISGTGDMYTFDLFGSLSDLPPFPSDTKNIVIESGVTSIGRFAFSGMSDLVSVQIPNSVKEIEMRAFNYCTNMKYIFSEIENPSFVTFGGSALDDIPTNARLIVPIGTKDKYNSANVWKKFTNVIEATKGGLVGVGAYYYYVQATHKLTIFSPGEMWDHDDESYYPWHSYRSAIQYVEIESGVRNVGGYAFYMCTNLVEATIPNSVVKFGMYAFMGCSKLATVISKIKNPEAISDDVFWGLPSNANLRVLYGTKSKYESKDGWKVFKNIVEIDTFQYKGINYKIIGYGAVSVTRTKEHSGDIVIPKEVDFEGVEYTVTSIEDFAFDVGHLDYTMTSITLPHTLKSIGTEAFIDQAGLKAVYISDLDAWCNISFSGTDANPLKYAHHLFLNGEEVTNLALTDVVKSINSWAFYGGSSFTTLTIPGSVTLIGERAFQGCSSLTNIVCDIKEPFVINNNVFDDAIYSTVNLYVLKDATAKYKSKAAWNKFTNIKESVFEINGINYRRDLYNNVSVLAGDENYTGRIVIPSHVTYEGKMYNVTSINRTAFIDCPDLTSVYLPEGLSSMGSMMFSGCTSLTCLNILNGVAYLETGFTKESNLQKLVIGSGIQKLYQLAIGQHLTALAVLATTPPDFDVDQNTVDYIYVPKGCITAYKDKWSGPITDILEIVKGDVNLDGEANEDDVEALADYIVGKYPDCFFVNLADLNGDNKIDASDLVELIDIIK